MTNIIYTDVFEIHPVTTEQWLTEDDVKIEFQKREYYFIDRLYSDYYIDISKFSQNTNVLLIELIDYNMNEYKPDVQTVVRLKFKIPNEKLKNQWGDVKQKIFDYLKKYN